MSTLTQAFDQWSNRPADERFSSLEALHAAVTTIRAESAEAPALRLSSLKVDHHQDEPVVIGQSGNPAKFSNWSFGQFARLVGAPPAYLRTLPASLVAQNLNVGIQGQPDDQVVKALFSQNGALRLRALTGDGYARIWNSDITSRLLRLVNDSPEWQPAPPAFDGSRGLYASDKDMFAFLVDNERRIFESLPGGGLGRGFFVSNSEVGDASFKITTFLYEFVCGNHRVWGAKDVTELRIAHRGQANDRAFRELSGELIKYANTSAADDELKIASARRLVLGADKDAVLDRVFNLRISELSRKTITAAFDRAEEKSELYGDPKTVWGLTGGMTEIARDLPNADDRVALDRAAGKVMQIAF